MQWVGGARFSAFIERQEHETIGRQMLDRTWPSVAVVIVTMVAVASWLPGARDLFRMDPVRGLLSLAPLLVSALVHRLVIRGRLERRPLHYAIIVTGMGAVDVIPSLLAAASHAPGCFVFVAMSLFGAGYHAWGFRASPQDGWFHAGAASLPLVGAAFAVTPETRAVLLVLVPAVACISYYAGLTGMGTYEQSRERERLREAVRAQLLADERSRAARLQEVLVGLLGQGHDLGNTVTLAAFDMDALELLLAQDPPPMADVRRSVLALRESLRRLAKQTTVLRELGSARGDDRVTLDAAPVLEEVARRLGERQPRLAIELVPPPGPLPVRLGGGEESLRRIVENLLLNALQGDGRRGAERVRILAELLKDRRLVRVAVEDDGPGFPPELLAEPVRAFRSTKPHGTGLGLFTCEKLASASGGALVRGQGGLGGARVELLLPFAEDGEGRLTLARSA